MISWRRSASWLSSASRSSLGAAVGGEAKVTPEADPAAAQEVEEDEVDEERWSRLLPELLTEIMRRVDAGAERWPPRRDVVVCACVCRRWRDAAVSVVRPPLECGRITFPSSLKQPGPRDAPMHCFIRRDKKNSTFSLYLSLTQALTDKGKFLLAARRFRQGAHTEYIISYDYDDLHPRSSSYVGKLRLRFWLSYIDGLWQLFLVFQSVSHLLHRAICMKTKNRFNLLDNLLQMLSCLLPSSL